MISASQLAHLAPDCDAEALAGPLSAAAVEGEIDTPLRLAHWLGQLHVESDGFTRLVEDLDYSAPRLMAVWPSRFRSLSEAAACAHDPQGLAARVYAGRMGNQTPADAKAFIGRGFIMLTGRAAYAKYGMKLGLDLIGRPDLAAQAGPAARIAAAYWADRRLNPLADRDDLVAITRAINGGLTGLEARRLAVARAKQACGVRAA